MSGSVALVQQGSVLMSEACVPTKDHVHIWSGLPSEAVLMSKYHAELNHPLTGHYTVVPVVT